MALRVNFTLDPTALDRSTVKHPEVWSQDYIDCFGWEITSKKLEEYCKGSVQYYKGPNEETYVKIVHVSTDSPWAKFTATTSNTRIAKYVDQDQETVYVDLVERKVLAPGFQRKKYLLSFGGCDAETNMAHWGNVTVAGCTCECCNDDYPRTVEYWTESNKFRGWSILVKYNDFFWDTMYTGTQLKARENFKQLIADLKFSYNERILNCDIRDNLVREAIRSIECRTRWNEVGDETAYSERALMCEFLSLFVTAGDLLKPDSAILGIVGYLHRNKYTLDMIFQILEHVLFREYPKEVETSMTRQYALISTTPGCELRSKAIVHCVENCTLNDGVSSEIWWNHSRSIGILIPYVGFGGQVDEKWRQIYKGIAEEALRPASTDVTDCIAFNTEGSCRGGASFCPRKVYRRN